MLIVNSLFSALYLVVLQTTDDTKFKCKSCCVGTHQSFHLNSGHQPVVFRTLFKQSGAEDFCDAHDD